MKLEDYNKKEVFTTPEGYFEELNNKIKSATCYKSTPKAKTIPFRGFMSYAAMIAIAFVVAAGIIYNMTGNNTIVTGTTNISELGEAVYDTEFIENMFTEYRIDEYTFYCYMTNTDNY